MSKLTQERLKELVNYDPDTGIFTWACSRVGAHSGDVAGCFDPTKGYRYIGLDNRQYQEHRVAILYMDGYMPENTVDHKNRIRHDNRYKNLREATYQCQIRNCGPLKTNTSGVKGVAWHKVVKKWRAQIGDNGKHVCIGYFSDFFEAVCHRFAAEQALGFQDCDINSAAKQYIDSHLRYAS